LSFFKTKWSLKDSSQVSISSTFYEQLLRWYYVVKKSKSKLWLEKSCAKHFHTKKVNVKCWWTWPHESSVNDCPKKLIFEDLPIVLPYRCSESLCSDISAKPVHFQDRDQCTFKSDALFVASCYQATPTLSLSLSCPYHPTQAV